MGAIGICEKSFWQWVCQLKTKDCPRENSIVAKNLPVKGDREQKSGGGVGDFVFSCRYHSVKEVIISLRKSRIQTIRVVLSRSLSVCLGLPFTTHSQPRHLHIPDSELLLNFTFSPAFLLGS